MRTVKLGAALSLFLFGLAFIFDWRLYEPFLVFFPRPLLLLGALVLLVALLGDRGRRAWAWAVERPAWAWMVFCGSPSSMSHVSCPYCVRDLEGSSARTATDAKIIAAS